MRRNRDVGKLTKMLAVNIRSFREANGMTSAELARALGVSQGHVSNLEKAKHPFGIELLAKISEVFGISIPTLIDDGDNTDKVRRLLGRSIAGAMGDRRFHAMVGALAKSYAEKSWLAEACLRLSKQ